MNGENEVRVLFAAVEAPPSRVDLDRAVVDGRRVVRHRRYAWTGAAAAVVAALAVAVPATLVHRPGTSPGPGNAPSSAPPRPTVCTVTRLAPPPGGGRAVADRIDPTGRYIAGARVLGDRDYFPALWTDGVPALVPVPGQSSVVFGVNAHGVLVGETQNNGTFVSAWVYRDGVPTHLTAPAGHPILEPTGVNAAGTVVGIAYTADDRAVAVRWVAGRYDRPEVLAAPKDAQAWGIDDDGTVVGQLGMSDGPYVWDPSGHGTPLARPAGYAGGSADAIRGDWIVGTASDPAGDPVPLRWNRRTGVVERLPGKGIGQSVNASGMVVVHGLEGAAALLDARGRAVTLPYPAGVAHPLPLAVADDGNVVGSTMGGAGTGSTDGGVVVRWSCG